VGGIDQGRGISRLDREALFLAGLFVGPECGCGRSGSIKVESVVAVRVVPELELAEAKDRAAVVDGLESDVLAGQCLAPKEPLASPLDLTAAPNASDHAVGGILDLR
jgi:hypothetical protein